MRSNLDNFFVCRDYDSCPMSDEDEATLICDNMLNFIAAHCGILSSTSQVTKCLFLSNESGRIRPSPRHIKVLADANFKLYSCAKYGSADLSMKAEVDIILQRHNITESTMKPCIVVLTSGDQSFSHTLALLRLEGFDDVVLVHHTPVPSPSIFSLCSKCFPWYVIRNFHILGIEQREAIFGQHLLGVQLEEPAPGFSPISSPPIDVNVGRSRLSEYLASSSRDGDKGLGFYPSSNSFTNFLGDATTSHVNTGGQTFEIVSSRKELTQSGNLQQSHSSIGSSIGKKVTGSNSALTSRANLSDQRIIEKSIDMQWLCVATHFKNLLIWASEDQEADHGQYQLGTVAQCDDDGRDKEKKRRQVSTTLISRRLLLGESNISDSEDEETTSFVTLSIDTKLKSYKLKISGQSADDVERRFRF